MRRRTDWPPYVVWVTVSVYRLICMYRQSSNKYISSACYTEGSLTAAPWGPGGPGIPAWPGPPCNTENRGRINCHLFFFFFFTVDRTLSLLSWLAALYLYSRNTRCAIFSINTRQTLKKQADESVNFIWRALRTPPWLCSAQTKVRHSHSLPFCQPRPVGPGYPGCPAEDNQTGVSVFAMHIKITLPTQLMRYDSFFFFCLVPLLWQKKKNLQWKYTRRVTYFVSLVSCLSGWSLRSLLTLRTTRDRLREP